MPASGQQCKLIRKHQKTVSGFTEIDIFALDLLVESLDTFLVKSCRSHSKTIFESI